MNWDSITFDWNQARAFLATAEEGSLSAAARVLGQTQPTLSRQVAALEKDLGVALFERIGRSMELTAPGRQLLIHVREMGKAASKISLTALSESVVLEGKVTLTATNTMAIFHLPAILARIRERAPRIELQVIESTDVKDLARREADIAIRHERPSQPELIAKLLSESHAHLYASESYLERYGSPKSLEELSKHQFIGFKNAELMLPTLNDAGLPLTRDNFKLSASSGVTLIEYVRQGLGLSVLVKEDAEIFSELRQILPEFQPIIIQTWLVAHRELHTSSRYRLVFDLIAEGLTAAFKRELR